LIVIRGLLLFIGYWLRERPGFKYK